MQIGIIGHGRLGRLLTRYLAQDFDVLVYDQTDLKAAIESNGAIATDLLTVCQCPVVIPMVPISNMRELLSTIAPLLKPGTLVIDVCSVKSHPVQWMQELLPATVNILGTHPMFGPDSARDTMLGQKIVLCPVRVEASSYHKLKLYLNNHGLKVIETTPEAHDREIAHSLLLTHFIGRGLMRFGAKPLLIDTKGYRRLMKILSTVENDSWQLFVDMNRYNPYASEIREKFLQTLGTISQEVTL